jgi:hypothetical protein
MAASVGLPDNHATVPRDRKAIFAEGSAIQRRGTVDVAASYDLISLRTDYGYSDGSGQQWILEIEKIWLLLVIAGAIN